MEASFSNDEAPLLAAREIIKHLDGAENFELPLIGFDENTDTTIELDYDGVVGLVEDIIRHFFSLEPRNETYPAINS